MKVRLVGHFMGLAVALALVGAPATQAADTRTLAFTIHAAFFSSETKQPKIVDPQVFVQDPRVTGGYGPPEYSTQRRRSPCLHRAGRQNHAALQRQG